jgi:hypothetical protein
MLTLQQKQALKTYILNDGTLAAHAAAFEYSSISTELNTQSSYVVWKSSILEEDLHSAYVWTEMDNLTTAKYNQLSLLLRPGVINTSLTAVRQGLNDIFSGAQLSNTKTAVLAMIKRNATIAEQLFALGTGTTGSPGSLVWEGLIAPQEISSILSS